MRIRIGQGVGLVGVVRGCRLVGVVRKCGIVGVVRGMWASGWGQRWGQ